jgi:hypothetical protein
VEGFETVGISSGVGLVKGEKEVIESGRIVDLLA